MKQNIKGNREKFKKQEREFEGVLDADKPNKSKEIVQIDIDEDSENED